MPSVGEFLIDRLHRAGIKHAFGVPGDYVLNFYKKLSESPIEVIGTTSESAAGFAADAYARMNGIGCVCVTYCVGGFSLLNPIGGAFAEKSPVVIISGSPGLKERQEKMLLHHMVREFECQHRVFENVTCANTVLRDPSTAAYEIDRVLEACKEHKRPVYIEIPRDIVDKPIAYALEQGIPPHAKTDEDVLDDLMGKAEDYINGSKKPIILAGVEVARFGFANALRMFAEKTNIPVATTILGKGIFDETHPLSLGVYAGAMSHENVSRIIDESDCLIMLGVMQTDVNMGFLPMKVGNKRVVLATSEETRIKNSYYKDIVFSDFMNALFEARISSRGFATTAPAAQSIFVPQKKAITVGRFFEKVNSVLTSNTAIIADIGESLFGAVDLVMRGSSSFFSPAFYTSMGFALPGCLGYMTAQPKGRPFVFVGDGAFQMTGMEMSTLVKRKLNPVIFVLNNKGYATERMLLDGPWNDVQEWNYHLIPQIVNGGKGYVVSTEEELDETLKTVLSENHLSIINVKFDKNDRSPAMHRFAQKFKKRL